MGFLNHQQYFQVPHLCFAHPNPSDSCMAYLPTFGWLLCGKLGYLLKLPNLHSHGHTLRPLPLTTGSKPFGPAVDTPRCWSIFLRANKSWEPPPMPRFPQEITSLIKGRKNHWFRSKNIWILRLPTTEEIQLKTELMVDGLSCLSSSFKSR